MKKIFECETEIGKCVEDYVTQTDSFWDSEPWMIFSHTVASITGSSGMLKVEQRCYLRRGEDILDQFWIKPAMLIEPAASSESEMAGFAANAHEAFIQQTLQHLPEGALQAA